MLLLFLLQLLLLLLFLLLYVAVVAAVVAPVDVVAMLLYSPLHRTAPQDIKSATNIVYATNIQTQLFGKQRYPYSHQYTLALAVYPQVFNSSVRARLIALTMGIICFLRVTEQPRTCT